MTANATAEAAKALARLMETRHNGILATSATAGYGPELVRHVANFLGFRSATAPAWGEEALLAGPPELASEDPMESDMRRAFAAAGDPLPGEGPEEILFVPGPTWVRRITADDRVLVLEGLTPPRSVGDARLTHLADLLNRHEVQGWRLPEEVTVVVTTDRSRWLPDHLEGFASRSSTEVVAWDGFEGDEFRRLLAHPGDDPMAVVDLETILGPPRTHS